jgi:hypothetical protein
MKYCILICWSLFCVFHSSAQENNGYYGKKIFVQIEGLANYPLFSNILSNDNYGYASEGTYLIRKKDNFNWGFRLNAGYALKRNFAVSLEVGQDYSSVYPLEYEYVFDDVYGYQVQHEMVDIATTVIVPKIEFGTSKSLLPMGLSHQLGFGVSYSKAIEKDYLYKYSYFDEYQNYSTSSEMVDPINFETMERVRKFVWMYALSMRTPINKSMMIHYGVKYTLNLGKPGNHSHTSTGNEDYTTSLLYVISAHRFQSFINANIGLTYIF